MKKKIINTTNREIYEKFSLLHFLPEVTLNGVEKFHVERIIKNINGDDEFLAMEVIGKYIVVRKTNPFFFDIYYKNK